MTRPDEFSRPGASVADVAVAGGRIQVETHGSGPPLLFVHGWTLDRRAWEPQIEALADRFTTVTFDRRGFGQSSLPPDLAREPDDIVAIADYLGFDLFAVVGMSQGARIALTCAIRHPHRVSALILQGAPLSDVPNADEAVPVDAMAAFAADGQLDAMRRMWRGHALMQVEGARANACLDAIVADYMAHDLTTPGTRLDVTAADLAHLCTPLLAITGECEPAWRHHVADIIVKATGGVRLDIPRGSHLCNLSEPDAFNAAVAGFLATPPKPYDRGNRTPGTAM